MSLIDTNVLLYATLPGFPEHRQARDLLHQIATGPRLIS